MADNHEPWLSAVKNDPRTEEQMRADHDRFIAGLKEPNPNRRRNMAGEPVEPCPSCPEGWRPIGTQHCADCYEGQIERLRGALKEAERFMSYFANETDGHFSGPGTPTSCLAQIRSALGDVGGPHD